MLFPHALLMIFPKSIIGNFHSHSSIFLEDNCSTCIFAAGEMAERSNAAVLKTVDCNRSGGSNPSLSAFAHRSLDSGGLCLFQDIFFKLGWASVDTVRKLCPPKLSAGGALPTEAFGAGGLCLFQDIFFKLGSASANTVRKLCPPKLLA